ncbi:MAG TPA: alpha/beta hydrolase [Opitutaceae bacterium]
MPPPTTISEQARAKLVKPPVSILSSVSSLEEQRRLIDARQARDAAQCLKIYPAQVSDSNLAGVPVRIVTPVTPDPANADRVLINLHGGGFRTDTGSLLESIPIANLTRIKVVAVLYGLAPEHPFPVPVDQTIAVYRELLKTYAPDKIALYGTSAGAILTAQSAAKIKQLGLPLPAVLGILSGTGDSSQAGDSMALFGMQGLSGTLLPRSTGPSAPDLKDPIRSPLYSDLKGMPPTLFLTSTRDMLLSGTVILHRAFLEAGVDAHLIVYEALPHAFWLDPNLPESQSANRHIAEFLKGHLR